MKYLLLITLLLTSCIFNNEPTELPPETAHLFGWDTIEYIKVSEGLYREELFAPDVNEKECGDWLLWFLQNNRRGYCVKLDENGNMVDRFEIEREK